MEDVFVPQFDGIAMQLLEDHSNIDAFAEFTNGEIRRPAIGGDPYAVKIYPTDDLVWLGDYASKSPNGDVTVWEKEFFQKHFGSSN